MTPLQAFLGVLIGLVSGILSGMFGVGGGMVMTPGIQLLLGAPPIVALATPLPAIFPTALVGAFTYKKAGHVDTRAAAWMIVPGIAGAVIGAVLTRSINTHLLLFVTAILIGYQAIGVIRNNRSSKRRTALDTSPWVFAGIGAAAGLISGLLGVGGGLIMVPLLARFLRMPLKTILGTSLLAVVALVVPGTIVHASLGHIDWAIFAAIVVGSVPGAWLGARIALRANDRSQRLAVGAFLLVLAVGYGASELSHLLKG
jgi:uncharacterized membrane protein YfcA